jgi:hypothetical protein
VQHLSVSRPDGGGRQELINAPDALRWLRAINRSGIDEESYRKAKRRGKRVPKLAKLLNGQHLRLDTQCGCRATETIVKGLAANRGDERLILEVLQHSAKQEVVDCLVILDRREEESKLQRQRGPALEGRVAAIGQLALIAEILVNFDMI